jgi:hypothetical protein
MYPFPSHRFPQHRSFNSLHFNARLLGLADRLTISGLSHHDKIRHELSKDALRHIKMRKSMWATGDRIALKYHLVPASALLCKMHLPLTLSQIVTLTFVLLLSNVSAAPATNGTKTVSLPPRWP